MPSVSSSGDIGDICVLLGILSELPDTPHALLLETDGQTKYKTRDSMYELEAMMKPLAESQSYISECRVIRDGESAWWKSADFRKASYIYGNTLLDAHVNHLTSTHGLGRGIRGEKQWLTVDPSPLSKDRIVIARSGRYRNGWFPWAQICLKYRCRLMFVGLRHEWREFCSMFGYVEYQPTANMLEVAEVIAGSLMFIGNQSSPNAIAEGLKHRMIQETCCERPDCIYWRENAQHVADGGCILPGFDGDDDETIAPWTVPIQSVKRTQKTPQGRWQYANPKFKPYLPQHVLSCLVREVVKREGGTYEEVEKRVLQQNIDRTPDSFKSPYTKAQFNNFYVALENSKKAAQPPPKVSSHFKHPVSR